jgi:hypothetical protein
MELIGGKYLFAGLFWDDIIFEYFQKRYFGQQVVKLPPPYFAS